MKRTRSPEEAGAHSSASKEVTSRMTALHPLPHQSGASFCLRHKLSVKNLRAPPQPPNQSLHHRSNLVDALHHIILEPKGPFPFCLTNLFNDCQSLVLSDSALCDELYNRLGQYLKARAKQIKKELMQGLPTEGLQSHIPNREMSWFDQIKLVDETSGQAWLSKLESIWKAWSKQSALILNLLLPVDLSFRTLRKNYVPIRELCLAVFRNDVIGQPWSPILHSISIMICHQITAIRSHKPVPREMIKSITQLIFETYTPDHIVNLVSSPLSQVTEGFYCDEGNNRAEQIRSGSLKIDGPGGFVQVIHSLFEQESLLHSTFLQTHQRALNRRMLNHARNSIRNNLILAHLHILLDFGFLRLLRSDLSSESESCLSKFYKLVSTYGDEAIQPLRTRFADWIKQAGLDCLDEIHATTQGGAQCETRSYQRLLQFVAKVGHLVTFCFSQDPSIVSESHLASASFLGQRVHSVAHLLASFFHQSVIQDSYESMNPTSRNANSQHAMNIFRLFPAKDLFERHYRATLARRLWPSPSNSIQLDRDLIDTFTKECGRHFTHKWQVMVRDIDTSKALNAEYRTQDQEGKKKGKDKKRKRKNKNSSLSSPQEEEIVLSIQIWTTEVWPLVASQNENLIIPVHIKSQFEKFEKFYTSRPNFSGRKLTCLHNKGFFSLEVNLSNNIQQQPFATTTTVTTTSTPAASKNQPLIKKISVHTFLALILLLFNDVGDQSIGFQRILEKTGLGEKEAIEGLRYLVYGTPKMLIRHIESSNNSNAYHEGPVTTHIITPDDRFSFNSNLSPDNLSPQPDTHVYILLNNESYGFSNAVFLGDQVTNVSVAKDNNPGVVTLMEKEALIEMTIVGIMKQSHQVGDQVATTSVKFEEIVERVQLKLGPRIGLDQLDLVCIKLVIESLVNKEFLLRIGLDQFSYVP